MDCRGDGLAGTGTGTGLSSSCSSSSSSSNCPFTGNALTNGLFFWKSSDEDKDCLGTGLLEKGVLLSDDAFVVDGV